MGRPTAARQPHLREVIVVEVYTEASYVGAVRDWGRSKQFETGPIMAKGQGRLIPAMQRINLDAYSTVWIVLDAERHPHRECERVRKYVEGQASPEYQLIITSPRVETWLLAHYEVPTGDGSTDEQMLKETYGYVSKRALPSGFDPSAWRTALQRVEGLELPNPNDCALCVPQSGLPRLVARLRGEPL